MTRPSSITGWFRRQCVLRYAAGNPNNPRRVLRIDTWDLLASRATLESSLADHRERWSHVQAIMSLEGEFCGPRYKSQIEGIPQNVAEALVVLTWARETFVAANPKDLLVPIVRGDVIGAIRHLLATSAADLQVEEGSYSPLHVPEAPGATYAPGLADSSSSPEKSPVVGLVLPILDGVMDHFAYANKVEVGVTCWLDRWDESNDAECLRLNLLEPSHTR